MKAFEYSIAILAILLLIGISISDAAYSYADDASSWTRDTFGGDKSGHVNFSPDVGGDYPEFMTPVSGTLNRSNTTKNVTKSNSSVLAAILAKRFKG